MTHRWTVPGIAVAALLLALALPGAASASFAAVDEGDEYDTRSTAVFFADDGETNALTLTRSGNNLIFTDPGSVIQVDSTCTVSGDGHTATCPHPANIPFRAASVFLDGGDDSAACNVTPAFADNNFTVSVTGGDGNDTITGCDFATPDDTDIAFFGGDNLTGGNGNDVLDARGGDDSLNGDLFFFSTEPTAPGNDRLLGGAGDDNLFGGRGNDEERGGDGDDGFGYDRSGDGNDVRDGGAGLDALNYEFYEFFDQLGSNDDIAATRTGATINLSGTGPARAATTGNGFPGESDALADIEDATGSAGADNITGSASSNILQGGAGNDAVTGGAGPDNLFGGNGDDTINAQDAEVDRLSCGAGNDKANVDNIDQISADCPPAGQGTTVVNVPPPAGPVIIREPKDTTKAVIGKLSASKKAKYATLRKNGKYKFSFTPNEVVTGEFTLSAKLGSRGRIATAGHLTLAEKGQTLAANKKVTITLTIPKGTRKALRKGKNIRLLIQLRDAGNNITSRRVTIKLS